MGRDLTPPPRTQHKLGPEVGGSRLGLVMGRSPSRATYLMGGIHSTLVAVSGAHAGGGGGGEAYQIHIERVGCLTCGEMYSPGGVDLPRPVGAEHGEPVGSVLVQGMHSEAAVLGQEVLHQRARRGVGQEPVCQVTPHHQLLVLEYRG